jgi:hypothetical protein
MLSKKVLQKELEGCPEYFTIDELVGRLIVLEKRQRDASSNFSDFNKISVNELDAEIEKWFKMGLKPT